MTFVVDASIAIKWLVEEDEAELAESLLRPPFRLVAPDLLVPEVTNAAWKAWRRGQLDAAGFDAGVRRLPRAFSVLFPTGPLGPQAAEIARALSHPAYDCFYLALADREGVPLVTADRRLARVVRGTPWGTSVVDLATAASLP